MIMQAGFMRAIGQAVTPALAIALCVLVAGCGKSEPVCQNVVKREAISPDGRLKAVLFERLCGATRGFSSQISILPVGNTETGKGNAFIADTAGGLAPAMAWGGPDVAMVWTSPEAITLAYAQQARVIVAEPSVRGVVISHEIKD
jgi:hypothetical protein